MIHSQIYFKLILLQRPAVVFSHLQEIERRFFEIVTDGSVTEVRLFLEEHSDFNINIVNFQVST